MTEKSLQQLRQELLEFAQQRDWEQFHSPKNLCMALSVEASELLEHFQWLTPEQSESLPAPKLQQVAYEMADVFIYLMRLSERLDVDLLAAVEEKIKLNIEKYPAEKVRGSAKKYNEY